VEKGLTVIAVLHDLNLSAQYCDELILLHKGKIYCSGPVEQVLVSDNIRSVYGIDVYVMRNPINGFPLIIPISSLSTGKGMGKVFEEQAK